MGEKNILGRENINVLDRGPEVRKGISPGESQEATGVAAMWLLGAGVGRDAAELAPRHRQNQGWDLPLGS